MKLIIRN